jgi:hypothetical protein
MYRKLRCELARKLVKELLEKEVSQKVSQCHLIYHGLFEVAKNLGDIEVVHAVVQRTVVQSSQKAYLQNYKG